MDGARCLRGGPLSARGTVVCEGNRCRIKVTSWTRPARPLADDRVRLRLPDRADAEALHAYASRDGGLDGPWVPLPAGASLASCAAEIDDWLAGWQNQRSSHGPVLVIEAASPARLAGLLALVDRGDGVIELAYGVAPDQRGQGYASHAARLVALAAAGRPGHRGRAAHRPGQRRQPAGRRRSRVRASRHGAGSGQSDRQDVQDLRFVMLAPGAD